ncbi:MAG: SRPBCC domain-containing protein [Pseudomonadota bacterium]
MSAPAASTIARVKRAFDQPAEAVFEAWLEPSLARQFFFATPPAGEVVRCDIEPGIGGRFIVTDRRRANDGRDTLDVEHVGRFLQLDSPRRLAFSFLVPRYSPRETSVIIDIEPQGDACELTLRHDLGAGSDAAQQRERAEHGWQTMLENLARVLARAGDQPAKLR